jgi:hypothetical protein
LPVTVDAPERDGDFDFFFVLGAVGGGVVWRPVLAGADFLLVDDPQPATNMTPATAITRTRRSLIPSSPLGHCFTGRLHLYSP